MEGDGDQDAICLLCRDQFSIDTVNDPNDLKVPIRGACTHNYCKECVINLQLARLEKSRVHILNLNCPECRQPTFRADALQVDYVLCRLLRKIRHYKSRLAKIRNFVQAIDTIESHSDHTYDGNNADVSQGRNRAVQNEERDNASMSQDQNDGHSKHKVNVLNQQGADNTRAIGGELTGKCLSRLERTNSNPTKRNVHHISGSDDDGRNIKRHKGTSIKVPSCKNMPGEKGCKEADDSSTVAFCTNNKFARDSTITRNKRVPHQSSLTSTLSYRNLRETFTCPHCSKRFSTESLLNCHIDYICGERKRSMSSDDYSKRDSIYGKIDHRNESDTNSRDVWIPAKKAGTCRARKQPDKPVYCPPKHINRKRGSKKSENFIDESDSSYDSDEEKFRGTPISSFRSKMFKSDDSGDSDNDSDNDSSSAVIFVGTKKTGTPRRTRMFSDDSSYESGHDNISDQAVSTSTETITRNRGNSSRSCDNDRNNGDCDDNVSARIMTADLGKLKSITAIIKFMDEVEPGKKYYKRQEDNKGECSNVRCRLRAYARKHENTGDIAVEHWQKTNHWAPPTHEALVALIQLIKILIEGYERSKQKRSALKKSKKRRK